MNKKLFLLVTILCIFCSSCKKEKIAIAGSGWQEIAIVDKKSGRIEWKHILDNGYECNDIEVTPEGNVLFAYTKGAQLINRNYEIIWDYKAKENEEIHSVSRLKDGGYLVAVCSEPVRIIELDNNGIQTKEILVDLPTIDINRQFRQVIKTNNGIYIIPLIEKRKILQISPDGHNIGSISTRTDLHSVKELKNNNYLVSCGSSRSFIELNPETPKVDKMIITSQIQGGSFLYVAEIIPLKNGNKLIANSNMYSNDKSQPLLIEINKDNDIIWSLPYNKEIKNITSIYSFFE